MLPQPRPVQTRSAPPAVTAARWFGLIAMAAAAAGCSHSKTSGPEWVPRLPAVQRTVLPNGLVVLSQETHSVPLVAVTVYYHSGSGDDPPGKLSLAHLVEHMTFRGTPAFPDPGGAIHALGGIYNGSAAVDYTRYYETVWSGFLPQALHLEADRMQHALLRASDLDLEKGIILAEDNARLVDPVHTLSSGLVRAMFRGQGYARSDAEAGDLSVLTIADVRRYYRQHYRPANATLAVVGDFRTADLLRQIRAAFGSIPDSPGRSTPPATVIPTQPPARITVPGPGMRRYLAVAFTAPAAGTSDFYALRMATAVLSDYPAGRLDRDLWSSGLAMETTASQAGMQHPYLFVMTARLATGIQPSTLERAMLEEVHRLCTSPVSPEELHRAFRHLESGFLYSNDDLTNRASSIAFDDTFLAPHYEEQHLANLAAVTPKMIQAAANRWLTPAHRTIAWLVPMPGRPAAAAAALPLPGASETSTTTGETMEQPALTYHAASGPTPLLAPRVPHAAVLRRQLPNGVTVLVYPNHADPDIAIEGFLRAGPSLDPAGREGVSAITATMVNWDTREALGVSLEMRLADQGSQLHFSPDYDGTKFEGRCLPGQLKPLMKTTADHLRDAVFTAPQLRFLKRQEEQSEEQRATDPALVAYLGMTRRLFTVGEPDRWPLFGTTASRDLIQLADVQSFYEEYYRPEWTTIAISGDVDPEAALEIIQSALGDWRSPGPRLPFPSCARATRASAGVYLESVPSARQAAFCVGFRSVAATDPDFLAAYLLNVVIGSTGRGARLDTEIRQRLGLAYSIRSTLPLRFCPGAWFVEGQTAPEHVDQVVGTIARVFRDVKANGVTEDELARAKDEVTGGYLIGLQSNRFIAGTVLSWELQARRDSGFWAYPERCRKITKARVAAAARRVLHPEDMVVSIAGPYVHTPAQAARAGAVTADVATQPPAGNRRHR